MADFGLTEDMYGTKYYHQNSEERNNEKVPIRWMAPESIERDIYNQSTDVVSSQASFLIGARALNIIILLSFFYFTIIYGSCSEASDTTIKLDICGMRSGSV